MITNKELAGWYLSRHIKHRGFTPVDSDSERSIGWECDCEEEGCTASVSQRWYNRTARHSGGAWEDYRELRARWASEMSQELIRRMHESMERKPGKTPEEKTAEAKAMELLQRFLSAGQREQFAALGYFEQVGGDGRLYRLWAGRNRSIELVEKGEVKERLCIHPNIWVPPGDTVLAQKLLIQGDIERVYKTANVTPVR